MARGYRPKVVWVSAAVAGLLVGFATAGYLSGNQPSIDVVAAGARRVGVPLQSEMVATNGIHLHVVTAGPRDGQPVILLHGMPEFWWGWNQQIAPLARAGFRVIVPDQRGYNLSDKPAAIEAYRMEHLAQDVVGLIENFGYDSVYLAAHDWGGIVAFQVAIRHPEKVRKLVIFNAPHPFALVESSQLPSDGERTITWYRALFQLPWIPELFTRFGNWAWLTTMLRGTSREGTFSDEELTFYKSVWARDGAIGSMINWYRAYPDFRFPLQLEALGDGTVRVPTRIVWGLRDAFMESRLARLSARHCTNASVTELPQTGHWLLH